MHFKFTLALSALALCLSVSALPLREPQELIERDSGIYERSLMDLSDESLTTRDVLDDPLDGLEARAKKGPSGPSVKPAAKVAPPPKAKGADMRTHVASQRAAKHAVKAAQRGGAGPSAAKQLKVTQRKENRELAKKQKWQENASKGKYKIGADGKPQNKKIKSPAKKQAQRDKYNNLSAEDKAKHNAASASKQAALRESHAKNKATRTQKRIDKKTQARQAAKEQRGALMSSARDGYYKSIAGGTFPGRKAKFDAPQGRRYTGKDVRQGLFNSHAAAAKPGGVGYYSATGQPTKSKDRNPKTFENRPNKDGSTPLPHMHGTGREFGIMPNHVKGFDGRTPNPTEARLITQERGGTHHFAGVVAHPAGTDDHIQVHAHA